MRLLEDHILQQRNSIHILQLHCAITLLLLANHHSHCLRLEQHTSCGDGRCRTVLLLSHTDTAEAHLHDTDTVELDLLSQFEEVLHRLTEFLKHGLDVTLLHRCLTLDEVRQFLGADEVVVIHRSGVVLSVALRIVLVLVLCLNKLLTHKNTNKKYKKKNKKYSGQPRFPFNSPPLLGEGLGVGSSFGRSDSLFVLSG